MERSSRELEHENLKIWIYFQKSLKLNFDSCWIAVITLALSIFSPTLVIDISMERSSRVLLVFSIMRNQKFDFIKKKKTLS